MFLYQKLRCNVAHIEFYYWRNRYDWFEGLASSRGYVFAMRELYPKQKEKLISWGFTVTTVGKVERSNALELCGVSALGAPKDSAAYRMLEVAAKRSKRLSYALEHQSTKKPKTIKRPYQVNEEGGGWNQ